MRKEPIIPSPTVTTTITVRKFGGLKDRTMPAKGRQALVIGRGNEPGLKDQSKSSEEAVEGDF